MCKSCRALARTFLLFLALAAGALSTAGPAPGQEVAPPVIAIIDVQKVLRDSEAVKALTGEIEQRRTQYQAELRKKEEQLRNADQELARQRTILSADVFAQKRNQLEEQVAAFQREAQERKRGLDQTFGRGMTQVQRQLSDIANEIAEERSIDLILSRVTVVMVRPQFDITDEALARLNARLPEVSMPAAGN